MLKIEGLKKTYKGGKCAVDGLDLEVKAGDIFAFIGHNGAGKTTLIDYIMNPEQRYMGAIRIQGENIRENHVDMRNKIGFVSEENYFLEDMTIGQNEALLGHLYDHWDGKFFQEMLKKVGLTSGKTVGKLSRGERMKFQVAFAAAHHPVLYLLDEVTAGMDPVFRIDFFKIFIKDGAMLSAGMLLWRLITYYFGMVFGGIILMYNMNSQ